MDLVKVNTSSGDSGKPESTSTRLLTLAGMVFFAT
jgi:hypothetical protein